LKSRARAGKGMQARENGSAYGTMARIGMLAAVPAKFREVSPADEREVADGGHQPHLGKKNVPRSTSQRESSG
jgi:hypothetical protein